MPKIKYFYIKNTDVFIHYDGKSYTSINEDDLWMEILTDITSKETLLDFKQKIKDTIGFEGELKFDSTMPDGNPRKLLDSSLINELGWESKIDLDEGLAKTYEWYLDNEDTLRS